jgi:hypothetical protein
LDSAVERRCIGASIKSECTGHDPISFPSSEQDPGTITYGYYADGMRKSLSLSVPALTFSQNNLYTYNYRPDGERSSLVSAIGTGNKTFAWTYTSAGRELAQTDPLTGASAYGNTLVTKSFTYDTLGQLSGLTLPRAFNPETSIVNDLEGSITSANWSGAATSKYQYTTRNETAGVSWSESSVAGAQFANGAVCAVANGTCTFDARSGQMTNQQSTTGVSGLANPQHGYTNEDPWQIDQISKAYCSVRKC